MDIEEAKINADVGCEVARLELLRLGNFVCTHDTDIDPVTLYFTGSCDDCPVLVAEARHPNARGQICRREQWFA